VTPATTWAGSHRYRAARLHRPATLEQVREVVAGAPRPHISVAGAVATATHGRLDPRGAFRNPWLEARLLGAGRARRGAGGSGPAGDS
jgi:hypothetical protein